MLGIICAPEQAAHRIQKIARLRWRSCAAFAPGGYNDARDGVDRLTSRVSITCLKWVSRLRHSVQAVVSR